jgi:hypothetical protein
MLTSPCSCTGFSPLRGFPGRADYKSVLDTMRLELSLLWPIPVMLDVSDATAESLCAGDRLALQDPEGFTHALLTADRADPLSIRCSSDTGRRPKSGASGVNPGLGTQAHPHRSPRSSTTALLCASFQVQSSVVEQP